MGGWGGCNQLWNQIPPLTIMPVRGLSMPLPLRTPAMRASMRDKVLSHFIQLDNLHKTLSLLQYVNHNRLRTRFRVC